MVELSQHGQYLMCGADGALQNMPTYSQDHLQAIVCVPEHTRVPSAAEAAYIGGGLLTLMTLGVLFASRHGRPS